ncbi:transposable element Tc1 transposase [Trichonephila clavipes]|nr:transposable element Tc1 transposase [Trichonephila clavipes]
MKLSENFTSVTLSSILIDIADQLHNFVSRSKEVDDTRAGIHFPNYPTTTTGSTTDFDKYENQQQLKFRRIVKSFCSFVGEKWAGRRTVFQSRWIIQSVPLEIVGEQWTREGTHEQKTGSGATRKTTRRADRRIMRKVLVDPTVTRSTTRADVGAAIVPQTISRHLAEANLKSKRPFRALPLTPEHRQMRLQWCQARSMWNVTDWQKRRPGKRYNFSPTVLRHTARTAGVMVWGAIAYDSRSTLIVMRRTLTGQRYGDDILRPHVGPFLNGLPGAIFQQDNALRIQQELLNTSYVIFKLCHGRPAPPICPL